MLRFMVKKITKILLVLLKVIKTLENEPLDVILIRCCLKTQRRKRFF